MAEARAERITKVQGSTDVKTELWLSPLAPLTIIMI